MSFLSVIPAYLCWSLSQIGLKWKHILRKQIFTFGTSFELFGVQMVEKSLA